MLHSALFRYPITKASWRRSWRTKFPHVTQRHLARAMEDQKRNAPLTGGCAGLYFAGDGQPAGRDGRINRHAGRHAPWYDQFHPAKRTGSGPHWHPVLQRSGFDPQAMPSFPEKLLDQARYSSRPPEILLTHPLPESRLSDARNRANQMRPVVVQSSQDFYMAKVRTLGMYNSGATSSPATCWMLWQKATCARRTRRNTVVPCRRWKPANTTKRENAATVAGRRPE